jgi:uncharacterized membrane protein YeaQ/YmgE (transglycosylase-associated protein family)
MMYSLIWPVVGALIGWLACVELGVTGPRHRVINVLAGAGGASFAGLALSISSERAVVVPAEFSVGVLLGAGFGAVVVLALVNLVRLMRMP